MGRHVKVQRGKTLRCKGWKQEAILRMLENNLENAEIPEELIIYGGTGKAARNWKCYDAIVESLKTLSNDETLMIQSGKPVAVFQTWTTAPRVPYCKLKSCTTLEYLGTFQRTRTTWINHVRTDDRGILVLHWNPRDYPRNL